MVMDRDTKLCFDAFKGRCADIEKNVENLFRAHRDLNEWQNNILSRLLEIEENNPNRLKSSYELFELASPDAEPDGWRKVLEGVSVDLGRGGAFDDDDDIAEALAKRVVAERKRYHDLQENPPFRGYRQLADAHRKNRELAKERDEATSELKLLCQRIEDLEARLETRSDVCHAQATEIERQDQLVERLSGTIESDEAKIEALTEKRDEAQGEIERLEKDLCAIKDALSKPNILNIDIPWDIRRLQDISNDEWRSRRKRITKLEGLLREVVPIPFRLAAGKVTTKEVESLLERIEAAIKDE